MRKTVRDVYCRNIVGVSEDVRVSLALAIMRERKISSICVLREERAVGIFTERDVVRCVSEKGVHFETLPISEVMSANVLATSADTCLFEAFQVMAGNNIRHLVVLGDDGRAIGMVTQSDMIMHLGYEYYVKVKNVSQIMSRKVHTVSRSCTVEDAIREMARLKVSLLVVIEDRRPVGVFTERDVPRLLGVMSEMNPLLVGEVMSSPVITMHEDEAVFHMVEVLLEKQVRRVVVVDDQGCVVGVATQTDLVRGMESKYIDSLKSVVKVQSTELDRAIRQLSEKTMYLDSILRTSISIGIAATDAELNIVYFNPAAEAILNVPQAEVLGRNLRELHLGKADRFDACLPKLRLGLDHLFSFEHDAGEGGTKLIQARASGIKGLQGSLGLVLMLEDVTSRRKAEETIRHLAYYDPLTDLPNRALFHERLERDLMRARRSGKLLALMVMDVDRFKEINDTLGHAAGDSVLRAVADRLRDLLRKSDTMARVGGDEFVFILPEVNDMNDARGIAAKVLTALAPAFSLGDAAVPVSFSLGIALFPQDGEDVESLLRLADQAMYRAKEQGRSTRSSSVCLSAG
ncbi:MAG: diguanylate cyclase [Humidesulfovibrio sp.]|uniref:diguanylate cyclase domain-containing protein n=1 Tax=Humidesulfovibrio sp. TaxID=2910988 RepID=UPI0027F22E66|nr:diguanylate cyclase [Humidesulfovibrio sp.]MDQ7834905.1 diguanylate cyclase [Humidesulfovibrio sp.]